jgi:signal transduction histidine kinase
LSESSVRRLLDGVVRVAAEESLPDVLRRIVRSSCDLIGARNGTLGVLGPEGDFARFIEVGPDSAETGEKGPVLGVPITVRGDVYGNLYLTGKENGEEFTDRDREVADALAAAAGVAIENATLFEQTRSRERWLEASHQVTTALITGGDPGATLRLIAEQARIVAGASAGAIARPREDDPSTLVFEVVESDEGVQRRLAGITVPTEGTATGTAYTSGKPVVVRHYGDKVIAQQAGKDVELPAMVKDLDSAVAVPLTVGDQTLGVLMVAKFGDRAPFTDGEVRLVRTFAGHAALAMEFARAEEDRRRLAVLEDRDRIARDLHDLVIQRLFATALGLDGLRAAITDTTVAERVTGFVHELDRTIRDVRNSIFSLQEPAGQDSVRAELLRLARDAAAMLGFEPRVGFDGPLDSTVPADLRAELLATLREGLSNVARHARATAVTVDVSVDANGHWVTLTVVDDGVGVPKSPPRRSGLANLIERADRWGGGCTVQPVPGGGTKLEWTATLRR